MTEPDEEQLDLDVGLVWREERVSCPHPDVLRAYEAGSLEPGAMEYLRFHIGTAECPYCAAVIDDLRAAETDDKGAFDDLRDRLLRSTRSALRSRRPER